MQPNRLLARMLTSARPPRIAADEDPREVDQARGHAALRHDGPGEDEERYRQQREVVGAVGDLQDHRLERQVDPECGDQRREAERVGDGHAQRAQQRERTEQDQGIHAYSSSAAWSRYMNDVGGGWPTQTRSSRNSSVSAPAMGIGR